MRSSTLPIVAVLMLVLAWAPGAGAGAEVAGSGGEASAAAKKQAKKGKKKAKRKACRKGYVRKTIVVRRKGKRVRVKRCRKKAVARNERNAGKRVVAPAPEVVKPAPVAPQPGPRPLFDPPGTKLEGESARTFVARYLVNSTFTDCPTGWPSCPSEQRYSHPTGSAFRFCALPAGSAPAIAAGFTIEIATVEADGSWKVDTIVKTEPRETLYQWAVAADGTVTGTSKVPGPTMPVPIGPLRYMTGARDC